VARRTRKQLVGKWQENNEQRERERDLRSLVDRLRLAWSRHLIELRGEGDAS
jgi:hypothetical protein